MPEEVYLDKTSGVIIVRSWGHVSKEEIYASKDAIKTLAAGTALKKVLVDTREQTVPTSMATYYHLAGDIGDDPVLRGFKCAFLASASTAREASFFETAANNRGIKVRLFQTMEEALAWLRTSEK